MQKDTLRTIMVTGITLVMYHLVVFLIPFSRTSIFWVSYGFTMVAFAVAVLAYYLGFLRKSDAKSRFYGFPITRIGLIYCIAQAAASLPFMLLSEILVDWVAYLVFGIGLGFALLGMISAESVLDTIESQDASLKSNVATMRLLQAKIGQVAAQSDDPAVKTLAEDFRFSDPVSSPAVVEIEHNLTQMVDMLQLAVMEKDSDSIDKLCKRTKDMLAERNRMCMLSKNR